MIVKSSRAFVDSSNEYYMSVRSAVTPEPGPGAALSPLQHHPVREDGGQTEPLLPPALGPCHQVILCWVSTLVYCTLYLPRASDNTRRPVTPVIILTTDTQSMKIKHSEREKFYYISTPRQSMQCWADKILLVLYIYR